MPREVYLLGAGGHGRVVLDALLTGGATVAGILDPGTESGSLVFGVPVLGGDDVLDTLPREDVLLANGVGAGSFGRDRRDLFERCTARGFSFTSLAHVSSVIGRECRLGAGSQLMAGAVLQNRVHVGENAVVNTRASVDHDCMVGAHSFIGPGAVLGGGVHVAESAFVGAGAVILPGVSVGKGAVVGAGATVVCDVPAGWIIARNPAVKIGSNTQ